MTTPGVTEESHLSRFRGQEGSVSRTNSASSDMKSPICERDATPNSKRHGLNKQLIFAIGASVIGSAFQHGYNTGVVNAPQKRIEEWIGQVLRERSHQDKDVTVVFSVFVAIFCVGGMLGGISTGFIADRYGRKGGLLINIVLVAISSLLQCLSKFVSSYEMLILGRFLIGVNSGLNAGLAPMYVSEISPVRLRGATGTVYQLVITTSILLSQFLGTEYVLGTDEKWPILFGLSMIPAVFQIMSLPLCPESPKFLLLSQGNESAARAALVKLRGSTDVDHEMDEMRNERENLKITPKMTILEMIFNPSLRIPLTISIMVMMGQQFSGINAVMFYSTKIFKMAGMTNESAQYATLTIGLVNVGMTVVSLALVERAGRKTLLLIGFQGMCAVNILFTICLSLVEKSTIASYLSVALVIAFVVMFAVGPGSIPWFIVSELFGQSARPIAASVAVGANWAANFIVGLGFLPLQELMNGYVFAIFAVLLALFSVFIKWKVPETKNKTQDEISAMFRQKSYK